MTMARPDVLCLGGIYRGEAEPYTVPSRAVTRCP